MGAEEQAAAWACDLMILPEYWNRGGFPLLMREISRGYPLALVSRRARMLLVPATLLMQVGILALLGPAFYEILACNVFWVPWTRALTVDQS